MKNQKFGKVSKILCTLLLVCFLMSVTAATVSAKTSDFDIDKNIIKIKPCISGDIAGHNKGKADGFKDGSKKGINDCKKGEPFDSSVIPPTPHISGSADYKNCFIKAYKSAYITAFGDGYDKGYHMRCHFSLP